jgi:HK97 family phage major capsid protein
MTRLELLNAQIAEKRGKLKSIFDAKPNKDFTTEELNSIKGLNDDLAPLATEAESLKAAEKIIQETESFYSKNHPVGETLPGAGGGTPIAIELTNGATISIRNEKGELKSDREIEAEIKSYATKTLERFNSPLGEGGLGSISTAREMADAFIGSAAFKEFNRTTKSSPVSEVEVKTLLDTTGFPVASTRSNMLVQMPLRRLVIADLIPNGTISQPRFLYMEETTATNGADTVAEGGTKPESALAFTERSADVRKIATVLPVTDELFEDAPAMRSYTQSRLTVFLQLAEEEQLLNGSGVAPDILGIMQNPSIQSQPKGADTIPDAIYKAIMLVEENSKLPVSGVALNPFDWQTIRLSKDANGNYLFGSPMAGDMERLFGYPVVRTSALTAGTGLVGAFDLAAMILRRSGIAFAASTEHSDFFIKNKLMLRVEERLAFPVFRPTGFCEVTDLDA